MRRGHLVHVVDLAAGPFLAVIALSIPAGEAALAKLLQRSHRHVLLSQRLVGAIGELVQRLAPRHRVGDAIEIGGRPVARPVVLVVAPGVGGRAAPAEHQATRGEEKPLHDSYTTWPSTIVQRTRPASS